jgi:hypothetical protein
LFPQSGKLPFIRTIQATQTTHNSQGHFNFNTDRSYACMADTTTCEALNQLESMLAEVAAPLASVWLSLARGLEQQPRGTHQRHCVSLQVPKNVGRDLPHL